MGGHPVNRANANSHSFADAEGGSRTLPRKLRWRMVRGRQWLDLVEEQRPGAPTAFIGLINGREWLRDNDRCRAATRLIKAALA